ncbi:MAG TPA: hypothetical protein VHS99_04440 [Chloroflexota bacterium]|jgi:hypothetical protein|nr:hypothetical protein [Chloroflexota bacterium]
MSETAPAGIAPEPPRDARAEALRSLEEGRDLLTQALEALEEQADPAKASHLVGRASDRAARAMYFLRQLQGR